MGKVTVLARTTAHFPEAKGLNNIRKAFLVQVRQNETQGMHITNRWSSRLGNRSELLVQTRKEPLTVVVVGGAAQLYVMFPQSS